MVYHSCYTQGCLGSYDVMHFGAWSDVSAHSRFMFLVLVWGPSIGIMMWLYPEKVLLLEWGVACYFFAWSLECPDKLGQTW